MEEDIFVGALYISPKNSTYTTRQDESIYSILYDDIAKFSREGKIMLMGDFNSRTGRAEDYIINDKVDFMPDYTKLFYQGDMHLPSRNNMDREVRNYGKQLLELCVTTGIRMLNGRTLGDLTGRYTCHHYNGSGVVDYCSIHESCLQMIRYFKVHDFNGTKSDHCPISVNIQISAKRSFDKQKDKLVKCANMFKWNEEMKLRFSRYLELDETKKIVNEMLNSSREGWTLM